MEETLGKRIAGNRKQLGITQDRLAEQLGVTAQAVSKWENDQSCPDITMLPKLAEVFGITVDSLLGLASPEPEHIHEAEVIKEASGESGSAVEFELNSDDGKWNFHWGNSRRGNLFLSLWVLLVGGILLASTIWCWNIGFWEVFWTSGLLLFGISSLHRRFSIFPLACAGFGTYFLLDNLDMLPFGLTREFILPIFLLLFGASLLIDAFQRPGKPHFSITRNGANGIPHNLDSKYRSSCSQKDGYFESNVNFGEDTHTVTLPELRGGSASVSFGESTVDLSDCGQIVPGCRIEADCSFGQLNLRIPRRFRAEIDRDTAFASVSVTGHPDPNPEGTIFLGADASFGEIRIIYI